MIHTNRKELTEDAKAILLLCGRFGKPADTGQAKPLSLGEYNRLADWMVGQKLRPADLLRDAIWETAPGVDTGIDADRIRRVLSRGAAMALAVEKWTQHGIWIICRSDPHYPERLKKHLKKQAPPVLFGVGDTRLLNGGGLAVVGSRNVDAAGEAFTRAVAEECAGSGIPIVSGGARGVDQIAMLTALNAGGRVVGVLADGLQKAAVAGKYRTGIRENRLVLISPFHPESRFNVGNAMGRNKYIYALSDYALVISAEIEKGGTWAGATEEMKRSNPRPVFVRNETGMPEGNPELIRRGAIPFPRPPWEAHLDQLLGRKINEKRPNSVEQMPLFRRPENPPSEAVLREAPIMEKGEDTNSKEGFPETAGTPKTIYEAVFPLLLNAMTNWKSTAEMAEELDVRKVQMDDWLKRAVKEKMVDKKYRPVRYRRKTHPDGSGDIKKTGMSSNQR